MNSKMLEIHLSAEKAMSREQLAERLGVSDREMRRLVRQARRDGIPVLALKTGGYKIAATQAEAAQLLAMYHGRAMDELTTYNRIARKMQIPGQLALTEVENENQDQD